MEYLGLWMFAAAVGLLLVGYPVAFSFGGTAVIFALIGSDFLPNTMGLDLPWDPVFRISRLNILPQRMFGSIMDNFTLVAVPFFVFMGVMLDKSGLAEDLLETMGMLFGPLRGGLALSVVAVGALLAASTGVVGASVVTMGVLALPIMLKYKYSKSLATGVIASSGTLGQIIPPSIVLVILGDQIGVSVGQLFLGAFIPGLMLAGLFMIWVIIVAIFWPEDAPAMPLEARNVTGWALFGRVIVNLIPPLFLILVVLGTIFFGIATPTEAGAMGAVGATLLALFSLPFLVLLGATGYIISVFSNVAYGVVFFFAAAIVATLIRLFTKRSTIFNPRFRLTGLTDTMKQTVQLTSMVFIILTGATAFAMVFNALRGPQLVETFLVNLPGGEWGFLFFVMLMIFILGFFIDFIEITFIVVPFVAPIALRFFGPEMMPWFGVLIAMNLQASFLTPPFGFALFYLKGVCPPSVKTSDIYKGIVPFIVIQLIALVLIIVFPQIVTWLPSISASSPTG